MPPPSPLAAKGAAVPEHCFYCFEVIHAALTGEPERVTVFDTAAEYPLFVTWNIKSRSSGEYKLRGCIGNFEPMALVEGLRDYAAISAFKDHRFHPITLAELPRLECGVSLLTDFELCDDHLDWTLESHGIYIQLPNPALGTSPPTPPILPARPKESFRSISALPDFDTPSFPNPRRLPKVFTATYLPDVASQQGWTKVEAIDSAIRKAGFDGVITTAVRASLRVTRYQSRKVELDYEAWMQWRSE